MADKIPLPNTSVIGQRQIFHAELSEMILIDYGVKKKPVPVRNPQANSIIEKIHQTIGNMIRSFEVHITDIDEMDPWTGIMSAMRFATRAT
eukprot:9195752-Ditylum_brightwellii.AAC.1